MEDKWPLFEVPVIAPDLRHEETLIQIADTLDYLSKVVDTVFNSINARISKNKEKINDLHRRACEAKDKVDKLTGSKKATQIFSSSKYPASDVHKDYVSIFSGVPKLNFTPSVYKISSKQIPIEEKSLEEKLQFYHVKTGAKSFKRNFNITPEEGLGKLPHKLESVSSLLLFNTSENPYKRYVTLDPMGVVSRTRKAITDEQPNQMEAAPLSISQQEQLETQVKENYFYSPSLGDVPNIDVPLDLPDLPGIADDLRYSLDLGPGFAPSVTTPSIPELPNIPEEVIFPEIKTQNEPITQVLNQPATAVPPAPPPPPPPPLAPPPPPPPPPPPQASEQAEPSPAAPKSSAPAIIHATSGDARANLMAAIRNAGGKAKLRSVHEGKDEINRIKEEKKIASGGDLMADLHNRLLMRRKGISGGAKKDGLSGSAMDKVSAMIPPPPQHQHQDTSSATEDDDWEE